MSSLQPMNEEGLGESWVDVAGSSVSPAPSDKITTPLPQGVGPDDYLRLLREAQRESNQSSAIVSLASTRKNSPHSSPKSPPNSPNTEPSSGGEELKGIYINYCTKEEAAALESTTDWVWDWSSRPDQEPPKEWRFVHPSTKHGVKKLHGYSIRSTKVGGKSLFSREVLYTVVLTNIISLLIGTGIGVWLSRRGAGLLAVGME